MGEFRESGAIIREAELLAGTPEAAAAWVKERSTLSVYFWAEGDQDTEIALLGMGSRLVDLALARYGRNREVLRQLYGRGDQPLRAAALANEPHLREDIFDAWGFTGAARDDFSWLSGLSASEFQALFANPALPDHFRSGFFEQKGAWSAIEDGRRREAIAWMTRNLGAREEKNRYDGWANYSHSKVFDAAWQLSAHAPTTSEWAATLANLYDRLPAETFSKFDHLEVGKRWFPTSDDDKTWNDEGAYKENGHLTSYQRIRARLARLAVTNSGKKGPPDLLSHADVAVRCGALMALQIEVGGIGEAVERDGAVAADALIENESVWRKEETRDALREACWALPDPHSTMLVPQAYNQRESAMRDRFPRWFADEDRPLEDATEVSMPADVAQLRQEMGRLQKAVLETRLFVILGLIATVFAYLNH